MQPPAETEPQPPARPRWPYVVGTVAAVALGAVFLLGLYAKVLDPVGFAETIERERLDGLLPAPAVAGIALGLEALLGFLLVMGLRTMRVLVPATALVIFFVFLTARAWIEYDPSSALDQTSCGCFGSLVERSPAEAFWQDLLLLVPACALAYVGRREPPADTVRPRWIAAGTLTGAVLVFAWFAPGLPLDDLATRLAPGVEVAELCAGQQGPAEPPATQPDEGVLPVALEPPAFTGRVCVIDLVPELISGEHLVILADLEGEALRGKAPDLNAYALDALDAPPLYVMVAAKEERIAHFQLMQQPAFTLVEARRAILRPLYRRLPRSFLVRDGVVIETWDGWPPLERFAGAGDEDEVEDEVESGDADPDGP